MDWRLRRQLEGFERAEIGFVFAVGSDGSPSAGEDSPERLWACWPPLGMRVGGGGGYGGSCQWAWPPIDRGGMPLYVCRRGFAVLSWQKSRKKRWQINWLLKKFHFSCVWLALECRFSKSVLGKVKVIMTKLWIAPPTKLDSAALEKDKTMDIFRKIGTKIESPGCSLCMGNQAQFDDGSTAVSTSTRNFPNRMGKDTRVYLASHLVAAVSAKLGRLPSVEEYFAHIKGVEACDGEMLSFDKQGPEPVVPNADWAKPPVVGAQPAKANHIKL